MIALVFNLYSLTEFGSATNLHDSFCGKKKNQRLKDSGFNFKKMNGAQVHPIVSDDAPQDTSQTSASSTGLGSFQMLNGFQDVEMDDNSNTGLAGVDQGADCSEDAPHALCTSGGGLPRTGYEPKSLSAKVPNIKQKIIKMYHSAV